MSITEASHIGGENGIDMYISEHHRFTTDSCLLAHFSNYRKNLKCCDLGSGCGIIPFLWCLSGQPGNPVAAVEIDESAVFLMKKTIMDNKLSEFVNPLLADIRQISEHFQSGSFDLVSCNPPYFTENSGKVSDTDIRATARSDGSCSLYDVIFAAAYLLKTGGRFCVSIRPDRAVELLSLMRQYGVEPKRLLPVSSGTEKAPRLLLIEGKRGTAPGLIFMKTLVTHRNNFEYSSEMQKIYESWDFSC